MGHTRLTKGQTRRHVIYAFVCALWLALGGVIPAQAAAPTVGALSQVQIAQPSRLLIPSLDIDAPMEAVGQDDADMMAAPSSVEKVAWYNPGPIPGENGNAVVAGHLDDVRGKPAVFWSLDELEAGAEIIVQFSDKSEKRFEVMTVETYDADAAPLERIFGVDFERDLNLITCDGQWNAQSKLYERRLVVYSRLIRETVATTVPENSTVATTALAKAAATLDAAPAAAEFGVTDVVTGTVDTGTDVASDTAVVTTNPTIEANVEYLDDATQTNTPSALPIPPSPRATHARQDLGQPLATH